VEYITIEAIEEILQSLFYTNHYSAQNENQEVENIVNIPNLFLAAKSSISQS
jgi:hypothetical protein